MKTIKILIFAGLLLVAYVANAQKNRYIKTNTYEGVVFAKYIIPSEGIALSSYFPSDKEISLLEKKITYSIRILLLSFENQENFKGVCNIAENLKFYKRQYYGYWYNGDKVIRVYFFLHIPKNWKEVMYLDNTGGQCNLFRLQYSIKQDKLYDFWVDLSKE